MQNKKQIPVQEGLFTLPTSPSEKPHLIGSKCKNCGEVVFPKAATCPACYMDTMEELLLGPRGKLYSFTNVNNKGPGGYRGPIPYGVGKIDVTQGARVLSLVTEHDPNKIKIGMEMELLVEKLYEDEQGNEVIGFKFKPDYLVAMLDGTFKESRHEKLQIIGEGLVDGLPKMNKPVIAAVNGVAVGAGFSIAMASDIRIASEQAKFGAVFVNMALIPDGGMTYFLPQAVGTSKALELMFTGEIFDARVAEQLGIVSRVVPHDELMKVTQELAAKIAKQPPIALALTKKLVYQDTIDDIVHHLDWETYAQKLCMQTEDHRESVLAFLEKRPKPQFKGK